MARVKQQGAQRKAYLTKRALIRATRKGTRSLSTEAMRLGGYIVKAENGWVVKIDNTGQRERISRLNHSDLVAVD